MANAGDLERIEHRLARLEDLLVASVACAAAMLLVAGALLPYLTTTGAGDDAGSRSLVTAGVTSLTAPDDGTSRGAEIAVGLFFLGLVAVIVLALVLLAVLGSGSATIRTGRIVSATTVLLLVGLAVVVAEALPAALDREDGVDLGPGILVLAAGIAVFALLAAGPLRRWWDPLHDSTRAGLRVGRSSTPD